MSNELKNDIRFIAVGAAGANVVKMLERKDYKSYYINLAKQDLDLIDSPNKLHISNGEGASKDRNKAKAVLAESVDDVMNTLDNQITEQYIFVVYSLAGGTGSGLGTFLASVIAENPNKKVGLVIILPSMNESLQGYTRTFTKRNWWEMLGMASHKYGRTPENKLKNLDYRITSWEVRHFYQRCNKKLEQILFSALNSLKNRKLITYEIQTVIVTKDKDYCTEHNIEYDKFTTEKIDLFGRKLSLANIDVVITDKSLKWLKFIDMMGGTKKKAFDYYKQYMKNRTIGLLLLKRLIPVNGEICS